MIAAHAARSSDGRQGERVDAGSAGHRLQDAAGRGGAVLAEAAAGDRPRPERAAGCASGLRAAQEGAGRGANEPRNWTMKKRAKGTFGEVDVTRHAIDAGSFEPQLVRERHPFTAGPVAKRCRVTARGVGSRRFSKQLAHRVGSLCRQLFGQEQCGGGCGY